MRAQQNMHPKIYCKRDIIGGKDMFTEVNHLFGISCLYNCLEMLRSLFSFYFFHFYNGKSDPFFYKRNSCLFGWEEEEEKKKHVRRSRCRAPKSCIFPLHCQEIGHQTGVCMYMLVVCIHIGYVHVCACLNLDIFSFRRESTTQLCTQNETIFDAMRCGDSNKRQEIYKNR